MSVPSYSGTMLKPAWLLLDADKKTIASVRADDAAAAKLKFLNAGLAGDWLRKV